MDTHTIAMNAQSQNPEVDSLTFHQNDDGSFTLDWNPEDPKWSWLNSLTIAEVQVIVKNAIEDYLNDN